MYKTASVVPYLPKEQTVCAQELVERVAMLLQQGADVEGSAAAEELEWLILQRRNVRVLSPENLCRAAHDC